MASNPSVASPLKLNGGGSYLLGTASLCASLILWQSFRMETDNLEKQVKLLSILVDGCKKHPAYRAIRPATGRCKPCVDMWQARQELEELDK